MEVFKFLAKKIFLRKTILFVSTLALFFLASFIVFSTSRSILLSVQGYNEVMCLDQEGLYIANIDPESDINPERVLNNGLKSVYDYLNDNYNYAFYTDGYVTPLSNDDNMEVTINYVNSEYYKLYNFKPNAGDDLHFDFKIDDNTEIPILVGYGLSRSYPIGTIIEIEDPALEQTVAYKVVGVLEKNTYHSNYYALNSKNYYNFTIIVPVNKDFISQAKIDMQLNGLFDIVIMQTSYEKLEGLKGVLKQSIGAKMNFYGQNENIKYYYDYYSYSTRIILLIALVIFVVMTFLSIWNAVVSVNAMTRDLTINMMVGLSISNMRKVFYSYYSILCLINITAIIFIASWSRYSAWVNKNALYAVYGFLNLIDIDWIAILIVSVCNIATIVVIVEIMIRHIRKMPLSLGVLQ